MESLKAGVTSILASLLPMVFVSPTARHSLKLRPGVLDPDRLSPRWEFQLDMLALDVLKGGAVELSFTGFDIGYDLNLFDDLSYLFFKCL